MLPFLSPEDFADRFPRDLTDAETLVATDALQVASNWIWNRLPTLQPDDTTAALVVFEVTRDVVLYGMFNRFGSFQNTTSHRTEMFSDADMKDFVTERHCKMLGIDLIAAPSYSFPPVTQFMTGSACGYDPLVD
jgi:hypothetical protein